MEAPVKITLDHKSLELAREIAVKRFAAQKDNPRPEYDNTLGGHFIGACGEMAAYQWASQKWKAVEAHFLDLQDESNPDIVADGKRIEVKTWSRFVWDRGRGRCVTRNQLRKYKDRSVDAVLWCHWKEDVFGKPARSLTEVEITGLDGIDIIVADWSTLAKIEAAPVKNTSFDATERWNHKVEKGDGLDDLLP